MDHSCQQARLRGIKYFMHFLFLFHIEETSSLLQLILLLCNSVTYLLITYTLYTLRSNSKEFGAYKVYAYPDSFRGESSQSVVVVGSWIGRCWKTGL
jgi:hypothetical protein